MATTGTGLSHRIKTGGYLISVISVALLGTVAWPKASESTATEICLIFGMTASVAGMFCRWLAYELDERRKKR